MSPGLKTSFKVVAVLAALASAAAAWFAAYGTYTEGHTGFAPLLSIGQPVLKAFVQASTTSAQMHSALRAAQAGKSALKARSGETPESQTPQIVSVVLPVAFSNSGAKAGCLADMALKLRSKTSQTRWTFSPAFFINMRSYLQGMGGEADPMNSVEAPIAPILLVGHQTVTKSILFLPRTEQSPAAPPLVVASLIPDDTYYFELHFIQSGEDCILTRESVYKQGAVAGFVLDKQRIDDLASGRAVLPVDEVRDSLRKVFYASP